MFLKLLLNAFLIFFYLNYIIRFLIVFFKNNKQLNKIYQNTDNTTEIVIDLMIFITSKSYGKM